MSDDYKGLFEAIEKVALEKVTARGATTDDGARWLISGQLKALMEPLRLCVEDDCLSDEHWHRMQELVRYVLEGEGNYLEKYHHKVREHTEAERRTYLCLGDENGLPKTLLLLPEGADLGLALEVANKLRRALVGNNVNTKMAEIRRWHNATFAALEANPLCENEWGFWTNYGNSCFWVFLGDPIVIQKALSEAVYKCGIRGDTLWASDEYIAEREFVIDELEKQGILALPSVALCD